jgi:hypothetical protein
MAPVFDGTSIRFLVEAYRRVYHLRTDPSIFLASHLAATRMSVQGLRTIGTLSTTLITQPVSPPFAGTRWLVHGALALMKMSLRRNSLLKALLNPVPPARWLVDEVGSTVESFADLFLSHFRAGLAGLENHNLDTGEGPGGSLTHPGTVRALQRLAEKGGWIPPELGGSGKPNAPTILLRMGAHG